MYEADITVGAGSEATGKPLVAKIYDFDNETEALLICNEIMRGAFEKIVDGYIGKCFSIIGGEIRPGKRYRDIDITQIELEKE